MAEARRRSAEAAERHRDDLAGVKAHSQACQIFLIYSCCLPFVGSLIFHSGAWMLCSSPWLVYWSCMLVGWPVGSVARAEQADGERAMSTLRRLAAERTEDAERLMARNAVCR